MRKRNPYLMIMNHAARGVGVHLTPDEVREMAGESIIRVAAAAALHPDDLPHMTNAKGEINWRKVHPDYVRRPK